MTRWIGQAFVSAFIAMVFIYIIKKVSTTYSIPVLRTISEGV